MSKKYFIYCFLLIVSILFFTSCSFVDNGEQDVLNHTDVITNADTTSEENTTDCSTAEEITIALSSSCDIVLASGTTETGDFYEVVAVENEDYTGTEIKIGVIKNNQWLIDLASDSPFLDENGLIGGSYSVLKLKEHKYNIVPQFKYIGNSCFYIYVWGGSNGDFSVIWNVEKNLYYKLIDKNLIFYEEFINTNEHFIIQDPYSKNGFLLDTNQMTVQKLNNPVQKMIDDDKSGHVSSVNYTPYSEGLYAITDYYTWGEHQNYEGFYDIDGNRVIDLSQYKFANNNFAFKNGVCEMVIINDQNSYYKITIDKTGNVINSEKIR